MLLDSFSKRVRKGARFWSVVPMLFALSFGLMKEAEANQVPYLQGTPVATATVGTRYEFQPSTGDADGDHVNLVIWAMPSWATFSNGVLSGTPTEPGVWSGIEIWADDGQSWALLGPFSIEVKAATSNRAPTMTGTPSATATVGQTYSFKPVVADPDGNPINLAIWAKPSWATFVNGTLSGTPTTTGTWSGIEIWADDGKAWTQLGPFSIKVQAAAVNVAPKISGVPATSVKVNTAYKFSAVASDSNGDKITFSIANKPAWATFSNGVLAGTPTTVATWSNIVISASDGKLTAALPAFSIQSSSASNSTPTISGTPPATGKVGQLYSFKPVVSDPDGEAVNLVIWAKPSWATFANGVLSGTPTTAGTWSGIEIWADDGKSWALLGPFSIQVSAAANGAPVISGSPASSVVAGSTYSFKPTASDPNGDTLYFQIANKPTWATFSTTTGVLSGAPSATQAGSYPNITITVSDGTASAALPAFAVTVSAPVTVPTGTATLSWTPPTQNVDGSALTSLAGYRIYYGTSAAALTQVIDIKDVSASSYVVGALSKSTFYFALKAYTTNGAESELSNIASKTIL